MLKTRITTITVAAAALTAGAAIPAFAMTPHYQTPPPKPAEPGWCKTYQPNGKNKNWGWDRDRCCPETVKVIKVRGRWEVVDVLNGRDCVAAPPKPRPEPSWTPPESPKPGSSWKPTPTPTPTGTKSPKPRPSWSPKPIPTVTVTVTATPTVTVTAIH